MMISHDDIDAAARADILSMDQASALKAFCAERGQVEVFREDEPFRFLSGFRDIFVAVGILILAAAFVSAAALTKTGMAASALGAAAAWGLAELVARKDRLSLSSILLSLGFVTASGLLAGFAFDANWLTIWTGYGGESAGTTGVEPAIAATLAAVAAGVGFYTRFKVPFVLAGLAVALILFVLVALNALEPDWARDNIRLVLGLAGLATFLAAMRFDISDRARVTRRSDCGFWLHLIAAPLIVHAFIGAAGTSGLTVETDQVVPVFALVAVITLIALVIDRRSMIVSALAYAAAATFATVSGFDSNSDLPIVITLFSIAGLVIGLGLLWPFLRRMILTPFERTKLADLVPPWRAQHTTGTIA